MSLPPALGAGPFGVSLGIIPRTLEDSPDVPSFPALPLLFKISSFLMQFPSLCLCIPFSWDVQPSLQEYMYQYIICTPQSTEQQANFSHMLWRLAGTWGTQISVSIDSVWRSGDVWKRGGRNQSFGGWVRGKGGSVPPGSSSTLNQAYLNSNIWTTRFSFPCKSLKVYMN